MSVQRFRDRAHAGRELARLVEPLRDARPVVVGLPRGGVIVAAEVAARLGTDVDVIVVRKLGVPWQPELAMGAIGEDDVRVVDPRTLDSLGVTMQDVERVEAVERAELERRARVYRARQVRHRLTGRTVLVVDDGIATGSTARAACQVARVEGAEHIVVAVPVAPPGWERRLDDVADECLAVMTPSPFHAIGAFYDDFDQTTDEEVIACLDGEPRG